jgi:hypothetical protein
MPKKLPSIPPYRVDLRGPHGEWRVVAVEHSYARAEWQYTRWHKAYTSHALRLTRTAGDDFCELLISSDGA